MAGLQVRTRTVCELDSAGGRCSATQAWGRRHGSACCKRRKPPHWRASHDDIVFAVEAQRQSARDIVFAVEALRQSARDIVSAHNHQRSRAASAATRRPDARHHRGRPGAPANATPTEHA